MGMMDDGKNITSSSKNYSFYHSNIILPRVTCLSQVPPETINTNPSESSEDKNENDDSFLPTIMAKSVNEQVNPAIFNISNQKIDNQEELSTSPESSNLQNLQKLPKNKKKRMKNKITPCEYELSVRNDNLFIPRLPLLPELNQPNKLQPISLESNTQLQKQNELSTNVKTDTDLTNNPNVKDTYNLEKEVISQTTSSQENIVKTAEKDLDCPDDKDLVNMYKEYLHKHCNSDFDNGEYNSSDIDVSVSSLSESGDSCDDIENTLISGTFEPLYSLPVKNKSKNVVNRDLTDCFNKVVITNANTADNNSLVELYQTGSLPDLHSLDKCRIKKVTHVTKNDSEPESEPGAQIRYKIRPLPPIPGASSNVDNSALYETIDKFSKHDVASRTGKEKKTFKQIASLLTLLPRVPTNQARSRKDDHQLADILKYLPDRKLKIFIGTWNMKGTKVI